MKRFLVVMAAVLAVAVGSAEGKGRGGGGRGGHSSHSGSGTGSSYSSTRVSGYTKKDGTHVQPHHRSATDGKFENNYTTKPNSNPFTGDRGTRVTPPQK